jgi:antitoxin component HigA of HigAB toxin-antitoxin module
VASANRLPRSYYRLVEEFPLKVIVSDDELAQAHTILERVFHEEGDEGVDAYVDVLAGLVDDYERTTYPTSAAPWQVLAHLIDARGIDLPTLARQTKIARVTLTRLLEDQRTISPTQAARLGQFFAVPMELFLPRKPAASVAS